MSDELPNDENHAIGQCVLSPRRSLLICIVAIACMPVLLYGVKTAFDSMVNDVADWLPDDFPQTATVRWYGERFGSDAILVASWPGCTVDDERLDRVKEGLSKAATPLNGGEQRRLFDVVFTGRDILNELTSPPLSLPEWAAATRMRGWLIGPNEGEGATACVVTTLTVAGWDNRHAAIEAVRETARSVGVDPKELRLGGPAVDSVAIDSVSREWLMPLGAASVVCALAFAWWCLRKVRFVLALFFYALLAYAASLSMVSFSGHNMDAVLCTMPALIYVLAVSAAVHMTGYYKDSVRHVGTSKAPLSALRLGWAPCATAAVTTALGVGSLMVSEVLPVKRFGIFAAAGVLVALVLLFAIWPTSIQCLMSFRRRTVEGKTGGQQTDSSRTERDDEQTQTWWLPVYRLAISHWLVILLLLAATIPVLVYGVAGGIRTSANLTDLYSPRSKIIRDYSWLESRVGPLIPVEVVLRFPEPDAEDPYKLLDRLQLVERTRKHIQKMPEVGGTLAATTFLPKIPAGGSMQHTGRRGVIAAQVLENRQRLIDVRYLFDEYEDVSRLRLKEELWRVSGRVKAMGELDCALFLDDFANYVNRFIQHDDAAQRLGVRAEVTGGVFLVAMAQKQLLDDLKKSFLSAFLLIAVAMMILTRSIIVGLISMVPNVFPALLAFGVMGWLDVAVDIGTMMSASVALGIAVDDTSHFLTWFRRGLKEGLRTIDAIRYAYRHCATAMLATSVICGVGMLVFVLSPFVPVARFALLMSVLLFAALGGNLILLAAVLASPVSRFLAMNGHDRAKGKAKARDLVNVE